MSRALILLVFVLSIVGCGSDSTSGQPGQSANGKDGTPGKAGQNGGNGQPGADGSAVNLKAPEQKLIGPITLADACKKAGIKPYPGSEMATGQSFDRGNGEIKDDITFETSDSMEKVSAYLKAQGLDPKSGPVAGNAMAMTKSGASIIVNFQKKDNKVQVDFKSVRSAAKP